MKKLIFAVLCAVLTVCVLLPLCVSADGSILFTDTFDTENPNNWMWDGTRFFVEDGVLKGWSEAKVHQSFFSTSEGGMIKYKESAWRVDCIAYDDGGEDAQDHRLGLWYADYIDPYATDDPTSWIIYKPLYHFETGTLELEMEFTGDEAEAFRPADFPEDSIVFRYEVPEAKRAKIGGDWFSLGIRINAGVVSLFYNDEKVVDFPAYRGTLTATQRPSPVLLLNGGCFCGFDNIKVSTPDYNLYNESGDPTPAPGPADTETEKVIETKVVHETDEEGNDVTVIVTEEVVRPAANTGTSTVGGNSAKTGDMLLIVCAVMIVSFGAAIAAVKLGSRG